MLCIVPPPFHYVGTPRELFFINFAVAVDVGFEQQSFQLVLVYVSESQLLEGFLTGTRTDKQDATRA